MSPVWNIVAQRVSLSFDYKFNVMDVDYVKFVNEYAYELMKGVVTELKLCSVHGVGPLSLAYQIF
jgi:hypothetical protein